jgi:RNA polymerase sigma factor (sigma-70 family)
MFASVFNQKQTTMKKQINKSQLFKTAWTLYKKAVYGTFSECLKHSWKITKLVPDFNTEFKKIQKELFAFAISLCKNVDNANELFQETAMKLYTSFYTFNVEKCANEDGFKWWAMTSMKYKYIDMNRKNTAIKRQHVKVDIESENENDTFAVENLPANSYFNSDGRTNQNELKNVLNNAISGLNNVQIRIINLLHDGYVYQEIADMLELPLNTVKVNIFRARNILAENVQIREYLTV